MAQKLPPPSRTVYKCEVAGKVTYSDDPCPGASRLEVVPTRGLNKSSGKEATGEDIQRERQHEALVEAVRPITGKDQKQFDQMARRMNLPPEEARRCASLDKQLPALEEEEKSTAGQHKLDVQGRLFAARKQYRSLRC